MGQKSVMSAAELESMIMAELREHPECDRAAVVIRPMGLSCDAVLVGDEPPMSNARQGSTKSPIDYATNSNWPNSLRTSACGRFFMRDGLAKCVRPPQGEKTKGGLFFGRRADVFRAQ
jgi:hypothetical protein